MPERIQLSRTKGWRMPKNTVKVTRGRGMKWGNPFNLKSAEHCWTAIAHGFRADRLGRQACSVEMFRRWLLSGKPQASEDCGLYAEVEGKRVGVSVSPTIAVGAPPPLADLEDLRGKNLACWCKLGEPCHADVLIDLANRPPATQQGGER